MFGFLKKKDDFVDDAEDEEQEIKVADKFFRFLQFFGYFVPIGDKLNPIKILAGFISMQIITVGMVDFLIHYLKHNKFQLAPLGDAIAGTASVMMAFFIQYTFLLASDGIHRLLLEIGRYKKEEVPKNWAQAHRQMNFFIKLLFGGLGTISIVIMIILSLQNCEEGVESDCGLLIAGRLSMVNVFVTPNRQIFMVIQTINAFHNGLISCSVAGVFITLSRCMVLLLEKLQEMILEVPKLPDRPSRKEQIKQCVLYHYKILEVRHRFAEYSTDTHFYILFFASINISLNAYNLVVMGLRVQMVLHLVIYVGFISIICFFGEKLIEASDDLCDVIYQSIPLDGDNATAHDMRFILLCSSRGIFIPAGKLAKVGLLRLQDLMSKSYSYFTMLINT